MMFDKINMLYHIEYITQNNISFNDTTQLLNKTNTFCLNGIGEDPSKHRRHWNGQIHSHSFPKLKPSNQ